MMIDVLLFCRMCSQRGAGDTLRPGRYRHNGRVFHMMSSDKLEGGILSSSSSSSHHDLSVMIMGVTSVIIFCAVY